MRYILLFLLTISLVCCRTTKTTYNYSQDVANLIDMTCTEYQKDSILSIENITNDFSQWKKLGYLDYETGTPIEKYLFLKRNDSIMNTIIIVPLRDGNYNFIKRVWK